MANPSSLQQGSASRDRRLAVGKIDSENGPNFMKIGRSSTDYGKVYS